MRLKVTDANGVIQTIEAESIVLGDGSFLGGINGAASVAVKSQPFTTDDYMQIDGTAQSVITNDIYLSGDVSTFDYHAIEAITADAKVEKTLDGTNWTQIALEIESDVVAGQPKSLTIADTEVGIYRGKCLNLRVRPNAATSTNARITHGNI